MPKAVRPSPAELDLRPEERARLVADQIGSTAFVRWCADLLTGRVAHDDAEAPSLLWLAGHAGVEVLAIDDLAASPHAYWPPVWAARGLLHVWDPWPSPRLSMHSATATGGSARWPARSCVTGRSGRPPRR